MSCNKKYKRPQGLEGKVVSLPTCNSFLAQHKKIWLGDLPSSTISLISPLQQGISNCTVHTGHRGSCEHENSDSLSPRRDLKFSISNKFPGGDGSAGLRTALWVKEMLAVVLNSGCPQKSPVKLKNVSCLGYNSDQPESLGELFLKLPR